MNMKNYGNIEAHVHAARLEYSIALGEAIADGIIASWNAIKYAARYVRVTAKQVFKAPASYSTQLRQH